MQQRATLAWVILAAIFAVSGCSKDKEGGGEGEAKEVPPKPSNGSPIAAEFVGLDGDELKVSLYNFGDKTSAGYVFLARFYDEAGEVLVVKPGTPFEKDFTFTSLSGGLKNTCEPKKHCEISVKMMDVPEKAARAEVLVSKVSALGEDGMKIEDWWSQESWSDWPEEAGKAGK